MALIVTSAGGLALSVLLQTVVLYAPPMHALFQTLPPAPETLLTLLLLASTVLWVEELRKLGVRRRRGPRVASSSTGQH